MHIWKIDDEPKALSVICDDSGQRYIDDAYRDLGIKEGWLRRTGYYFDYRDRYVYTYKIITRPKNPKLP